jgi:hypothetical protein
LLKDLVKVTANGEKGKEERGRWLLFSGIVVSINEARGMGAVIIGFEAEALRTVLSHANHLVVALS